jgi:GNAT superfamily N-acetyltransferase
MWSAIRQDVPIPPGEERAEVAFERWFERFDRPEQLPEGYMLAVDGDQFVGTSQLWRAPAADELRTGLTGVRREYRRRGIALALKVHTLAYAKAQGCYRRVLTENESNNRGMLSINERLGFVKKPVWAHYLKTFAG